MSDRFDETIRALAAEAGIQLSYQDALGHYAQTPVESLRAVLSAMGFDVGGVEAANASLDGVRGNADHIPPLVVADAGGEVAIPVGAHPEDVPWTIVHEDGSIGAGRAPNQGGRIVLPPLPLGYHQLVLDGNRDDPPTTIIVAPRACWQPPGEQKRWGLSSAVYGLASADDLGIGDFADVAATARAAGASGASFLGISPLHALFSADRSKVSPYWPSSRLFRDPIYIDPRGVDGLEGAAGRAFADAASAGRLTAERGGTLVDYHAVWRLKRSALWSAWQTFQAAGGSPAFDRFRSAQGEMLIRHATFEAFGETERERGGKAILPPPPDSRELLAFRRAENDRVAFHSWLQWIADEQLAKAHRDARDCGMEIGLLADLAVGAAPIGSEVWSAETLYLTRLSIGAPPDQLAPQGQNWGLRTLDPLTMRKSGLTRFRQLVEANMRHAGGIRVDHVFQLRRLFLIPDGGSPHEGAYVSYPTEAMLAVLRIESQRARCLVVGEDLGTSPPDFAHTLGPSAILGYRVLYFERSEDGGFKPPAAYDEDAMAVINTHDLATLRGWWQGRDVEERLRYAISTSEEADAARQERSVDRYRLTQLLLAEGLLDDHSPPAEAPIEAVIRLLARVRARFVGVHLDDIVGAVDQQNVPGVTEEAPNWRRRLPVAIADIVAPGGPLDRLARAMAAEGRMTKSEDRQR
jgi:(1->4)-alpha-D-glucan 1-alpha-D-glucosylmutase